MLVGRTYRGWLHRVGYRLGPLTPEKEMRQTIRGFMSDLARLAADLELVVAGYHPQSSRAKWKEIDELLLCASSGAGLDWLRECVLRIYAPSNWLLLWRNFFSKKLGFDWIPASVDDSMMENVASDQTQSIPTLALDVKHVLNRHKIAQAVLADVLSQLLKRSVSRQRIGRMLRGQSYCQSIAYWIDQLLEA
jgi:hypothetical protein